ncbi:TniQ family protein [Marivirga sp. S37H4]|uniref:TniQ family protein n=1 Tax=Marivirga aurantiaca TaxID=2802615 RepID=A0A934WYU8_9BACT|nr:TniQ family protein [Marivirga aurantiaca]MBK6265694.1 TniQ family protein [Marivirga aurantiaca]
MSIYNTKLPVHLQPLNDELLTSWLLRYSKRFQTKYHTFCKFLFKGTEIDTRDIDLYIKDDLLYSLTEITFLSKETLKSLVLTDYFPKLTTDPTLKNWILTRGHYHRLTNNNHLMYCSSCFVDDKEPYYRKRWRLIISTVCTKCGIKLRDNCPSCNLPISFLRLDFRNKEKIVTEELCYCYNCDFDLRDSERINCSAIELDNQKQLESYLDKGYTNNLNYSHLHFEVLFLLLRILSSRIQRIYNFDKFISDKYGFVPLEKGNNRTLEMRNTTLEVRTNLMEKAIFLLNLDQQELVETCKESKIMSHFLYFENKELPYWFAKMINENLTLKYTYWKHAYPTLKYLPSYKSLSPHIKNL